MERTFIIIKPDAVQRGLTGEIIKRFEQRGFKIAGMKLKHLTLKEAQGFYAVHKDRPFFGELTEFMSEGPVVVLALEKEGAIKAWRDLMGATNPANAAEGTIRKKFAESVGRNSVHGSDAPETAAVEIPYFFATTELV